VGNYSLTAVATNDAGQTTTSAAVAITVKSGVAQMYYIHPDHLNTPRMIANQQGQTVWRWDNQEPFGSDLPNDDPGNTGNPFVFNLRFPGQYFDRETGLSYNVMRDYDSGIGRYVQADPVGSVLFGNMSLNSLGGVGLYPELARSLYRPLLQYNHLYAYVSGNPISKSDPLGLLDPGPGGGGGGGGGDCPLIAQSFLGFVPPVPPLNLITWKIWLCVYDCNEKCPGTKDKLIVNIQWDLPPYTGCLPKWPRPRGI
jgi:RHS repeat-associated protein